MFDGVVMLGVGTCVHQTTHLFSRYVESEFLQILRSVLVLAVVFVLEILSK